jgi:hypothetical protein
MRIPLITFLPRNGARSAKPPVRGRFSSGLAALSRVTLLYVYIIAGAPRALRLACLLASPTEPSGADPIPSGSDLLTTQKSQTSNS